MIELKHLHNHLKGMRAWCLVILCCCLTGVPAATNPSAKKTLAIIQPQNVPAGDDQIYWESLAGDLLRYRLSYGGAIRVLPGSSLNYACQQSGMRHGSKLSETEALGFGQAIEADYVAWADFHRSDTNWLVEVHVAAVSQRKSFTAVRLCSPDWTYIAQEASDYIRNNLGTPSLATWTEYRDPFKANSQALDLLAKAIYGIGVGTPISNSIELLDSALRIDPNFSFAHQALANLFVSQGRLEDARLEAKKAVQLNPQLAPAHFALGGVYLRDGSRHLAEAELNECIKVDPDWPDSYIGLSDLLANQGRWSEAITVLRQAALLAPYDSQISLRLALAYIYSGNRRDAVAALKATERLPLGSNDERILANAFRSVNELPRAAEHYRSFLSNAEKAGLSRVLIEQAKKEFEDLRTMMLPVRLPFKRPKVISREELSSCFERAIGGVQGAKPVMPFACTLEMTNFCENTVTGAREKEETAKRIFEALSDHVQLSRELTGLTAVEAFGKWRDRDGSLTCQDLTYLYMALARAVNLETYYVLVKKDYNGNAVPHVCAGVAFDDNVILVDLTYNWFGVPHQAFEVEDDLRAVAGFLAQTGNSVEEDAALKLASDWAEPHFWAAVNKASRGLLAPAEQALEEGLKLDSTSWLALFTRGFVEENRGALKEADADLRGCIALNPDLGAARFHLAATLYARNKLTEARDEFRTYLLGQTTPDYAAKANLALIEINRSIAEKSDYWRTTTK